MRRIITIGREFGSGGRELGKRLSDALEIPCYDKEIISMIARNQELNPNYVDSITDTDIQTFYPTTIGKRLNPFPYKDELMLRVFNAQTDLLRHFAESDDCLIIGRCADVILEEYHPMRIFVYAGTESKIRRCRDRMEVDAEKTDRELVRDIRSIDRGRRALRNSLADTDWGNKSAYDLCVNTSGWEIKRLVPLVAQYVTAWFERTQT